MTKYWLPYTFGALGLSAFTLWLLRHSSLMGSSDIDNWLHGAKKLLVWCWDENVQKPVRYSIYILFFFIYFVHNGSANYSLCF